MRLRFVALLLLTTLGSRLSAQQGRDTARTRDTTRMSEIVVTATRVSVPVLTSATTTIRAEELRVTGTTHVIDALREVPGLTVVQTGSFGGTTAVYLRGGESGYTRVLIDGVPVNEPGGGFDFGQLTTEGIDRIEIVRGPTSVLYGSDAVSGVVQIFTRDGRGASASHLRARAGTYGTTAVDATLEGGDAARGYSVTVGQFDSRGIYPFNNQYRHRGVTASARLIGAFDIATRVLVRYAEDDPHVPTDGSGAVVDSNAHNPQDRRTLAVQLSRALGSMFDAALSLGVHSSVGGFDNRSDSPGDTLGFYAFRALDNVSRKRVEAIVTAKPTPGYVITGGASIEDQAQHSISRFRSEFGDGVDELDASRSTRAAYVQAIRAGRRLSASIGARVDDNDAFGAFGTYRVGVALTPTTITRLRVAAGTAFREPTFFQNFATGIALGNPDLRPERSGNWEVGADQELWHNRLVLSVTHYRQRFQDVVEYTFAPPQPTDPNFFNIAAARSVGTEVELRATPIAGLRATASYTAAHTEVDEPGFDVSTTGYFRPGSRLLRRPERQASGSISYVIRAVDIGARWSMVGPRDDIDYVAFERITLPQYSTVDVWGRVRVRARGRDRGFVTARMSNALGEAYQATSGYPAPGRALLVGVQVDR